MAKIAGRGVTYYSHFFSSLVNVKLIPREQVRCRAIYIPNKFVDFFFTSHF